MTIEQFYKIFLQHPIISTDTRKIEKGSLFFALKGDRFNANTFAEQALE
ncbi:MAG: UDP-N-acetylmuramoyl-tripeptide--D-alanyl-D-alanine ligase, partial [Betaproteobacteria bacterium]|nr:UDP-N-acetylmuramoyl-tripeptide--D-alanyl-D-alanine ligase [Betaproteobacteria bacterium]